MSLYKCSDGDRIDLIVLNRYGDLKHLNNVVAANKQLFGKPLILQNGTTIELPTFETQQRNKSVTQLAKTREPLW